MTILSSEREQVDQFVSVLVLMANLSNPLLLMLTHLRVALATILLAKSGSK